MSDSTNRRDILRKFKVDDESPAQIEGGSVPLDEIAGRYNLGKALEASRNLKRKPEQRASPRPNGNAPPKILTNQEDIEHDFTTRHGTPSNLECPFARMANGNPHNAAADPIAAEFHGEGSTGSGTAYAQQNPNKCPIRYLDQHSPAEVAKYFENHKHEIPRSHAVCVSRYQQNNAKIRELDAKYGNLQNMIQSLGVKHQQYLPTKDEEETVLRGSSQPAAEAVEKWAENVSQRPGDVAPPLGQPQESGKSPEDNGERTQQFQTPLREVRLGESPSRPWGISVPHAQATAASAMPSDNGIEPLSLDREEGDTTPTGEQQKKDGKPAAKCPFGHGTGDRKPPSGLPEASKTIIDGNGMLLSHPRPQMIFNGPVFFGYSPEQAVNFMQSGSLGPTKA